MSTAMVIVIVEGVVVLALFVLVGYLIRQLAIGASHRIARILIALAVLLGAIPPIVWALSGAGGA